MLDARVALARALCPSLIALASCAGTAPPPRAAADTVSVRISEMPLVFRITVAKDAIPGPTSGRLFVFLSPGADRKDPFETDNADPARVLVASKEVTHVLPGATLELDPSHGAFPDFGTVAPGSYAVTALLDVDHSLPHTGPAAGDVVGPVVKLALDPGHTGMVDLRLERVRPAAPARDSEALKRVHQESALLTSFFGRPVSMDAAVVLPPSHGRDAKRRYATAYLFTDFGFDPELLPRHAERLRDAMSAGWPEMVYVVLDGTWATGHHLFADSANNGPWSRALVEELVPRLEKDFALSARPASRLLVGMGAGGWAALWQQVTHPDLFGGAWAIAPDALDFRAFTGLTDVTPDTRDNFYRTADGAPHVARRAGGRTLLSTEDAIRRERVQGEYGGRHLSREWVFSPRGDDGQPLPLFDRMTGAIDAGVARAWERYDVRKRVEADWRTQGPRLRGKLHVLVGAEDDFHLEVPSRLFCDALRGLGALKDGKDGGTDATCDVLPGQDHWSVQPADLTVKGGLLERVVREMQKATADAGAAPVATVGAGSTAPLPASAPSPRAPRTGRSPR